MDLFKIKKMITNKIIINSVFMFITMALNSQELIQAGKYDDLKLAPQIAIAGGGTLMDWANINFYQTRDQNVNRFVYAASSSTYGDSEKLPKREDEIGVPLSPYAITKYVNELYASIFKNSFNLDTIGLRYFNVFGRKQDPKGAYAAVIPKFVIQLINHEAPTINGDGSFSRDFTYIGNVIRMNFLALTTTNESALNQIYNTAVGDRTTLVQLMHSLKKYLSKFDPAIANVKQRYGPNRLGDIPHSQASIDKAVKLLNYKPTHDFESGLKNAVDWYWESFKN
jgi:UDP-N-acetylglucosamine 4-epimerase